jgi:hypothetical protein
MITGNAISIEIPAADLQIVKDALATIQTTLAYVLALTPEQRKTIPNMSDGTFRRQSDGLCHQ